jgi:archaellum component FlaC
MKSFLKPIIEPLLLSLAPSDIVQIGCADGQNTVELLKACEKNDASLHAIDKSPAFDVGELQKRYKSRLQFHRTLALNVLAQIEHIDLVLLDGDSNWYAVFHLLKEIDRRMNEKGHPFPCVLVHNVGWPYGRRDAYLDPEDIPEAFRNPYKKQGLEPGGGLTERGGLHSDRFNAIEQNGQKNGVLTAVEDFIKEREEALEFVSVQISSGLGILYPEQLAKSHPEFKALVESISPTGALAALLEQAEIERLEAQVTLSNALAKAGDAADKNKRSQSKLRKEIGELNERLEEDRRNMTRKDEEMEALRKEVKQALDETGSLRERLDGLTKQIEDKDALLSKLHSELNDAEIRSVKEVASVEKLRQALEDQFRQSEKLREELRRRTRDLEKVVAWADRFQADLETHLHSWTWKVGSLALEPVRWALGKRGKPVEALSSIVVSKKYKKWRSCYRPNRP